MDRVSTGVLLGLLIGEAHFGGDGRQPQVTVRMHARHEPLLRRLVGWVPGSRLYGPYHHSGRHYVQWMARGGALLDHLVPLLDASPLAELDPHTFERYRKMKLDYGIR